MPVASLAMAGFTTFGRLATLKYVFRGRNGFTLLRLTSSSQQGFAPRITPTHAHWATCGTGNLHDRLLSVCKTKKASPDAPKNTKEEQDGDRTSLPRFEGKDGCSSSCQLELHLSRPQWARGIEVKASASLCLLLSLLPMPIIGTLYWCERPLFRLFVFFGASGEAFLVLQTERSLSCKLPVPHVAQ